MRSLHRHVLRPVALSYSATGPQATHILFRCFRHCAGPTAWASITLEGKWTWADLDEHQLRLPAIAPAGGTVPEETPPLDREPEFVLNKYADGIMTARTGSEEPGYVICTTDAPFRCWVLQLDGTWQERPHPFPAGR